MSKNNTKKQAALPDMFDSGCDPIIKTMTDISETTRDIMKSIADNKCTLTAEEMNHLIDAAYVSRAAAETAAHTLEIKAHAHGLYKRI